MQCDVNNQNCKQLPTHKYILVPYAIWIETSVIRIQIRFHFEIELFNCAFNLKSVKNSVTGWLRETEEWGVLKRV